MTCRTTTARVLGDSVARSSSSRAAVPAGGRGAVALPLDSISRRCRAFQRSRLIASRTAIVQSHASTRPVGLEAVAGTVGLEERVLGDVLGHVGIEDDAAHGAVHRLVVGLVHGGEVVTRVELGGAGGGPWTRRDAWSQAHGGTL